MLRRAPRPRPTAWASALAGLAAGSVGIAVSEVVAGGLGGPSLPIGVGALVILLQPPGAKDAVVALFGTGDKLALDVVVVAVALGLGGLAGVVAGRRFAVGAAGFVALGAGAALAAMRAPLASLPIVALGTILALGAALATLWLLLGIAPGAESPRTAAGAAEAIVDRHGPGPGPGDEAALPGSIDDPETPEWSRRRFLIASAGTVTGAAMFGAGGWGMADNRASGGVLAVPRLPAAIRAAMPPADLAAAVRGVTPLVTANDAFYRIDTGLTVPDVDVSSWTLEVSGMVDHPLTLTYDELLAMPLFEQYVTIACVSNPVAGQLVGNALWTGVHLRDVLAAAGVQPGATQIVGRSYQDFWAGFPTSWAMAPGREPMIAVGMNRVPLPAAHGFPARLVVPGLYGYVSATKWLTAIQLTTRDAIDGFWVPLGWAKDGPILTQSRIDVPASGAVVPAGRVEVAGVAWAPDRGIREVEVRIDDGPWQAARLMPAISAATWVQWVFDWAAGAGRHHVEVRATDGTGDAQTDRITPAAPDGAHGHHRITVTVA